MILPPERTRTLAEIFYICVNLSFELVALLLTPYLAIIACFFAYVLSVDYCTREACTAMQRFGSIVIVVGILFTFFQEFLAPSPHDMAREIRDDDLMKQLRKENRHPWTLTLLDRALGFADRYAKLVARTVEVILLAGGTLINGFGDIGFQWLFYGL